jgi:CBS domain-containing protein
LYGFTQVYDYVDGKVDWMAYGLPVEGDDGPFVGEEVDPVPTCAPDQTVADARRLLEESGSEEVVVVAGDGLAVGLVDAGRLEGAADDAPLPEVMAVVPGSIRPSVTVESLAERDADRVLVTTSDGRLLGVAEARDDEDHHGHNHAEEERIEQELDQLMEAAGERFGDREPSREELHAFLRERLIDEGRSPEEADRLMADLGDESPS